MGMMRKKGVTILDAAAMPDFIHLYVEIPPKYSIFRGKYT